jgi:hypothetical protein
VASLRNWLLSHLAKRGCREEILALQFGGNSRDREYIDFYAAAARRSLAALKWAVLQPRELLQLLADSEYSLARSNAELQRQVLHCVRAFDVQLRGLRLSSLMEIKAGTTKSEPHLSLVLRDWIQQHLKVAGNCECTIPGGERSDVKVQVTPSDGVVLTVLLEVKWDHRKDLLDAMKTQLLDLYMKRDQDGPVRYGIYVVGWANEKPMSSRPGVSTIASARSYFENQATTLSAAGFHLASHVLDCRPERLGGQERWQVAKQQVHKT